jgi:hypothetical protein
MERMSIAGGPRTSGLETASGRNGSSLKRKVCVVSYSLTGNNDALAASLAQAFNADHIRLVESGRRTMATIAFDVIFNRTPRVQVAVEEIEQYELALFVGPVWMGQIASPLRACFKDLQLRIGSYAFVSICGGADGPNPKLAGELRRRMKHDPFSVVELHIADLLPPEPKPKRKDTMIYRLTDSDVRRLSDAVVEAFPRHSSRKGMV